jgi:hypothetical protein
MSKVTELAAGQITKADRLTVELVQAIETPPVVLVRWPDSPSVLNPNPRELADIAKAVVRVLAEAQTRIKAAKR